MGKAERLYARIGLVVGCGGFVLLALAQMAWGFAAVLLLGVVAVAAGLATAKWLPRSLYGQQLVTGGRAGVLACGTAAIGLLVSLAVAGGPSFEALARRSHLLGAHLESVVHTLRPIGWVGIALVFALVGIAIGTGLAAVVSQLAAWDKNQRALQVIERAREAAQRSSGRHASGAGYSGQARRPTGALPVLPVYPPLGQTLQSPTAQAPTSGGVSGHQAPPAGRAEVLHDALAAWAEGATRTGAGEGGDAPASREDAGARPASDRDNWLC